MGPVLFNIYVSNLPEFIQEQGFRSSIYANDTNARKKFALQFQLYNIAVKLPYLIERITNWMNNYFLKINPSKTEIILFSSPSMKSTPKIQGIFVNDGCIRFSESVKVLGVQFDSSLTFDKHVSKRVSECWYHIRNIQKIRRYLTEDELKKVVHAVISSKIDYCNSILYGVKMSTLTKLQAVQSEAAKIVCLVPAGSSISDQSYKNLHWLKVKEQFVFKMLLLVHKFLIGKTASYFSDLLLVKCSTKRLLYTNFMNTVWSQITFICTT